MTSIEWLISQLNKQGFAQVVTDEEIQQAKEIHKAEIEDAFQDGKWDWNEHITNGTESKDLEQYYKETFKK
jgi:NDP-sugar pyrophosphorylase family protein